MQTDNIALSLADTMRLRSHRRVLIRTALAATALTTPLIGGPAFAQGAQQADDADRNVIVVTAQRRAEALEEVPMTITAVSAETMAKTGVTSLRDLQNVTTGFQLGQGGGFPQPAIRGISTILPGTSFENNVAVYIDGFYQITPQALNIDLPNVESIQVLKGPQGTLYGRNATGGAILINTITPKDRWEGNVELTYGKFDDRRASVYVAGPIGDNVGISLAGYTKRSDGWIKLVSRTTPGETEGNAIPQEKDAIRAKLQADLSSNFRATVAYNYSHVKSGLGNQFSNFENVGLIYANPVWADAVALRPTKLGTSAWDVNARTETWQHEGTLVLELDTAIGTLKSYTGYSSTRIVGQFDFDGTYINLTWSESNARQKTFQQTIDYTIDAIENVDLVIGGTYFQDKLKFIDPFIARYSGVDSTADPSIPKTIDDLVQTRVDHFSQKKEAWAIYADVNFSVTEKLTLNVGGRYSDEKQDVFADAFGVPAGNVIFPATNNDSSYSKFTPRASIRYEIAPRTNIYASYSKGFRSGAWNASLPADPVDWTDVDQETVDAFEVGFKTAQDRYRFELAGFYYDYKNLQVNLTETVGDPPRPITRLVNAPSAEIYGIEGSFDVELIENFNVRGGATWLHARYGDGFLFNGVGVNPNVVGLNTNSDPLKTFANVSQIQDLSGLQMPRSPDFTAFLGFDFLIPDGDGGLLFAGNAKYTDSYVVTNPSIWGPLLQGTQYADREFEQRLVQDSFVLLNASVQWTDPTDSYYLRLWGTNLTDKKYRAHYNATSFGTYSPINKRRAYGITIGYKFREE